ncbi:MAG: xanthine dehydrogenase small subunit [Kordiimonadaceae bacterium]|nr:xanthine dehydrogenase small subunit [Kordiimonadaceae bacterium]MBO6567469.1 xanthine dehydrogenase small subunit [Kordiimonadaceae bacterium]MBO6963317.1 xanthine dehydrogenase small subunit [Kordiimonadaceae bacterium]
MIFGRNGKRTVVSEMSPHETVLDYLRLREGAMGTKEGCCEGDCGACTVVVRSLQDGKAKYEAINSCIAPIGSLDGRDLITVDDLAASGQLHPVQQAMADKHASQCGFCTPGFVMALYALYENASAGVDRTAITDGLAGNLCRCTGYRPIIEAGLAACNSKAAGDAFGQTEVLDQLKKETSTSLFIGNENSFFAAPATEDELAQIYAEHPDAIIVAGATDVGLWITKHLNKLQKIIYVGRVKGFRDVATDGSGLTISAGATYTDAEEALAHIDPDIGEVVRRIGSKQVRNAGTIGGNIANGSPIGDTPPLLIALDAELTLRKAAGERKMRLEDFFIDYGKQDRKPGEFVKSVFVPNLAENDHFRAFKLSKRFDQDISAVLLGSKLTLDGATIAKGRIAFGGMAATPKRAKHLEAWLKGASLENPSSLSEGVRVALKQDFAPISDMRASAEYRLRAAHGLVMKSLFEIGAEADGAHADTRLVGMRQRASA